MADSRIKVKMNKSKNGWFYETTLFHQELNKRKSFKDKKKKIVQMMAEKQMQQWDEQYKVQSTNKIKRAIQSEEKIQKQQAKKAIEQKKNELKEATVRKNKELKKYWNKLNNIFTIDFGITIDQVWDIIFKRNKLHIDSPSKPNYKVIPEKLDRKKYDDHYKTQVTIFTSSKKKKEIIEMIEYKYHKDLKRYNALVNEIEDYNAALSDDYSKELYTYEKEKERHQAYLESLKNDIIEHPKKSIEMFYHTFLELLEFSSDFPFNYELEYSEESKILAINYELPTLKEIRLVKEYKHLITKNEINEVFYSNRDIKKKYDTLIYSIIIKLLYELYDIEYTNLIEAVHINGFVITKDPRNGKEITPCILSLQTKREEVLDLNLLHVDPAACFRSLKGVAASSFSQMTPVKPLMNLNMTDSRFTEGYGVVDEINQDNNLAMMHWQDFENLIREIFEKEFSTNGGEVKITQGSRDGGVDAVAYDPDPIRGGKMIIQAKRYTNVVGVSAVRDLYGTVQHEGANKGILVTTSNYGPDAYNFAKDKPITLLDGSNLLSLLEKHGYKATIDIKEAKKHFKENL